jgi:hypothetical protein
LAAWGTAVGILVMLTVRVLLCRVTLKPVAWDMTTNLNRPGPESREQVDLKAEDFCKVKQDMKRDDQWSIVGGIAE